MVQGWGLSVMPVPRLGMLLGQGPPMTIDPVLPDDPVLLVFPVEEVAVFPEALPTPEPVVPPLVAPEVPEEPEAAAPAVVPEAELVFTEPLELEQAPTRSASPTT